MNYLVTALVSFLVAWGSIALTYEVYFPRSVAIGVILHDLGNCYADLDACETLRNGMECR